MLSLVQFQINSKEYMFLIRSVGHYWYFIGQLLPSLPSQSPPQSKFDNKYASSDTTVFFINMLTYWTVQSSSASVPNCHSNKPLLRFLCCFFFVAGLLASHTILNYIWCFRYFCTFIDDAVHLLLNSMIGRFFFCA